MDTPIRTDPHNSMDRIMVLLNGMGEYKGKPVRIHVNESVRPVAQPYCRILFHVRKQVEGKLDNWKMRTLLNALRARRLGSRQL